MVKLALSIVSYRFIDWFSDIDFYRLPKPGGYIQASLLEKPFFLGMNFGKYSTQNDVSSFVWLFD